MQNFILFYFYSFSDIFVYFCLISQFLVHYSFCFYITESSCLISAKFPCCIYLIDSYFPHAMEMCTMQGSPKVHFFSLAFSFWKF
jgi:hypothetical protein